MPKILVGCLVVLVLVVGGGGIAGYFFVIKPGYELVTDVQGFVREYAELNEQIEHGERYQPPADGSITPEQFQRYLVAQRHMREHMDGRMDELRDQFESLQERIDHNDGEAGLTDIITAYRGLGDLLLEAKRGQVEALNRYNFSLQEYLYVRNQTYRAIGQEVAVAAYGEQARPATTREVPEDTVEMVAPHREELLEGYVLAWFGI